MMEVPLTARIPKILAQIFVVFFTDKVRSNDHMCGVLAVFWENTRPGTQVSCSCSSAGGVFQSVCQTTSRSAGLNPDGS